MQKQLPFLILFLCLVSYTCLAQNYRTIRSGTTFYTSESHPNQDYKNLINAIRIDSVGVVGSDTMFYNFPQIRYVDICIRPDGPSWIGRGMLAKPDGTNLFFNAEGDTIPIKTQAKKGESWIIYSYADGKRLRATVTGIDTMTFLGITDSVKTISLQMLQWQNIEISDKLNSVRLKLSKNYGFVKLPNFYSFPSKNNNENFFVGIDLYPTNYTISGIDHPSRGIKNLSLADAFDLYPMDLLHVLKYNTSMYRHENTSYSRSYQVVGREESADTLWLSFNISTRYEQAYPGHPEYLNENTFVHQRWAIPKKEHMSLLPLEPVFETTWTAFTWNSIMYIDQNGRIAKDLPPHREELGLCKTELEDTCYNWCFNHWTDYHTFLQGLGGPYYEYEGWWNSFHGRKLVYYRKGNEEWGTPLNIQENNQSIDELKVNPNPATDKVAVTLPENIKGELLLLNSLGQTVYKTTVNHESSLSIDLSAIAEGVYILKVGDEKGDRVARVVKY